MITLTPETRTQFQADFNEAMKLGTQEARDALFTKWEWEPEFKAILKEFNEIFKTIPNFVATKVIWSEPENSEREAAFRKRILEGESNE